MSAGRPREAAGALARKTTCLGALKRGRPEDNRWWESNPGRTIPSRGRPAGRVRHAFPAAMPSARSRVRRIRVRCPANFRVATGIHCPVGDLSSHRTVRTRRSREIRLTWERVRRILRRGRTTVSPRRRSRFRWNPERASRCGARCAASRCPSSGGPVASPRTPNWATRPRRHPRKRRQLSRSFRGAASQRRLFPFAVPLF
jgi:hypothetical protein